MSKNIIKLDNTGCVTITPWERCSGCSCGATDEQCIGLMDNYDEICEAGCKYKSRCDKICGKCHDWVPGPDSGRYSGACMGCFLVGDTE